MQGCRGRYPPAALAIPTPGERTISNAEVPLPRSPSLLGCRLCSEESVSCRYGGEPRISAAGFLLGRDYKCRKQSNARGAGGGAPGKIKLESPPSRREGGWGDGGRNKAKGMGGRRPKPPCPPPGTGKARLSGNHPPAPPAGRAVRPLPQCRAGSGAGMQGAEPLA